MIVTYQYRLVPTKAQHRALEALLESQRQLYNAALEERIGAYRHGISRTYFDQTRALTEFRRCDPEAAAIPANIQRATLHRLDNAYKQFFRRLKTGDKPGFPRFRGKGWWHSFGFREFRGISLRDCRLRFEGMPGALRVHLHRPFPSECAIRSCTFRHDPKGWKVGFAFDIPAPQPRPSKRIVGLDLGITNLATLSDGGRIPSLNAARRSEGRLRHARRSLARKQRGSLNRNKARRQVRRIHASIKNQRANFLHQVSARLVRDYDRIIVERLNIRGLSRGFLAKHIHDAAWGRLITLLRYKAERAGSQIVEVDAWCTTQACSQCGHIVPKSLDERQHTCGVCGLTMDRDLNAARNILYRGGVAPGLRNVVGCDKRAGGNLE